MVAKSLDLNNLSWRRRSFALSNKKRKVIGYHFVSECNDAQESHYMSIFFFCHICRTMVCWDPQFCYHGNMMYWLLLSIVSNVWYILVFFLKKQTLKKRCITELELKLTLTFKKLLLKANRSAAPPGLTSLTKTPFSPVTWFNFMDICTPSPLPSFKIWIFLTTFFCTFGDWK